ncbi:MAG TPA: (4Fe-4S)-binding protein [Candidatus Brocadiia bacterium]|nr:(4Fe-4S)-binding protein [Candidatus Brocadiia bacterium]
MITSQDVKQWGLSCGADLVGIGDINRFEGSPLQYDPRYIFPEAKSIIGLAFRVHRGLYRGIEEGTWFAGLPSMGYASINDVFAPMVLRQMGNMIEDQGYEAVLYPNTSVRLGSGQGKAVAPGLPKPDVFIHFRVAAYICGMGEIGWSKVFLTPKFGPRQRFAFILTDAALEPDPMMKPGTLCDRCKRCCRECPAQAISATESVRITVAGNVIEWGALDEQKCAAVYQAGTPETSPFMPDALAPKIRKLLALPKGEERSQMLAYSGGAFNMAKTENPYCVKAWDSYHHPGTICGARGCQRACFIHLEERGKLENKFHAPFRIRKPWRLDAAPSAPPAAS